MRIGLQNTDWKYIGAKLARADDVEQCDFFKAFIKECLSWGTGHQVGLQLAYINDKLTEKEREVISMLGFEAKSL